MEIHLTARTPSLKFNFIFGWNTFDGSSIRNLIAGRNGIIKCRGLVNVAGNVSKQAIHQGCSPQGLPEGAGAGRAFRAFCDVQIEF